MRLTVIIVKLMHPPHEDFFVVIEYVLKLAVHRTLHFCLVFFLSLNFKLMESVKNEDSSSNSFITYVDCVLMV